MGKDNPLVSVVMPAYNAEKYLDESINSILGQTFRDFEFIIINDGSKDNSLKLIRKYKKKDKRIIVLNNKSNLGIAKTRTKGIGIAKGKYIATFDADDVSLPRRLEIQFNYLEKHPDIFLIGGSAILVDDNGNKMGVFKKFNNPKKLKKRLLKTNPIVNSSTMFRNIGDLYYRDKFDGSDEYDFFLRLLSQGKIITNIENFLVKYRMNPNSISFKKRARQEYFSKKIQEFYFQRERYGKDKYEEFDLRVLDGLKEGADYEKIKLMSMIIGSFQDNKMREVRLYIKDYFKKYGIDKSFILYYIASFLPYRIIMSLRKII